MRPDTRQVTLAAQKDEQAAVAAETPLPPRPRRSVAMALLRNLKAVVMGILIVGYLVIGAFFALAFLVVPPAVLLRPLARRTFYNNFINVCFGNYWYSSIYILEQMTGTKVETPIPNVADTHLSPLCPPPLSLQSPQRANPHAYLLRWLCYSPAEAEAVR